MRQALTIALVTALLGAPIPAGAQALSGEQLRQDLTGNTLSGFNTSGVVFTEYHAPDGRVLGYNQGVPNEDACWTIRGNAVCYYYPRGSVAGEFCWRLEAKGPMGFSLRSLESATTGVARLAPATPAHSPTMADRGHVSQTCPRLRPGCSRSQVRSAEIRACLRRSTRAQRSTGVSALSA